MRKIQATLADEPRSTAARNIAWIYAAVLVVMVVGQLFSFEKFIPLIESYALPGGARTALLVAGLIVTTEVFALPFLLRMPVSLLMRWFSLLCGAVAAGIWLGLAIFALMSAQNLDNSGMLGTKIAISAGFVQLCLSIVLTILAIMSIVGLWPSTHHAKK